LDNIMSNLSQFSGGGGGGLTPKFQEFTSSGTFTPSQTLIDAGGYIEVFLVGGGGSSSSIQYGGSGGEVLIKSMYLTSTSAITVTIGSGGASGNNGSSSFFNAATAGGIDLEAKAGQASGQFTDRLGAGFTAYATSGVSSSAGSGVLGYGAGGRAQWTGLEYSGIIQGAANSGQGAGNGSSEVQDIV
jgi:hypothetical protein